MSRGIRDKAPEDPPTELITQQEAERRYGLRARYVYAAVNAGLVKAYKAPSYGYKLYDSDHLRWLAEELQEKSLPQIVFEADRDGRIELISPGSSLKTPFAPCSSDSTVKWAA